MKLYRELIKARLEQLAGATAGLIKGLIYYRTDTNKPYIDTGAGVGEGIKEIMVREELAGEASGPYTTPKPILYSEGGTSKIASDLAGQAGLALVVNPTENGYEFAEAGGGSVEIEKTQIAHGLALLDAIYHDGIEWVKALADDGDTLTEYVIVEVIDVDNFKAAKFGQVEVVGHGLAVGEHHFLSDTVAGGSVVVEPSQWSSPLFYVEDANTLHLEVLRPAISTSSPIFTPVENAVWGKMDGTIQNTGGDTSIIDTITYIGPHYRIAYVAGLTSTPDVQITPAVEANNYTFVPHVDNESLTGCDVTIKGRRSDNLVFDNGSNYAFAFHISKTGGDYTDPLVVAGAKTEFQRKVMTISNNPSELGFNNLSQDEWYRLTSNAYMQVVNNFVEVLAVHDGATILRHYQQNLYAPNPNTDVHEVSRIFKATATSITFSKGGAGTFLDGSFSRLEHLPNYEETTKWT